VRIAPGARSQAERRHGAYCNVRANLSLETGEPEDQESRMPSSHLVAVDGRRGFRLNKQINIGEEYNNDG
jgi:hypothetical protein